MLLLKIAPLNSHKTQGIYVTQYNPCISDLKMINLISFSLINFVFTTTLKHIKDPKKKCNAKIQKNWSIHERYTLQVYMAKV